MKYRVALFALGLIAFVAVLFVLAASAQVAGNPTGPGNGAGLMGIGAGLAIGLGAVGTGIAQSRIGGAAAGVIAERPELFGTMLVLFVIPETLVIFGFVIAILLFGKL